MKRDLDEMMEAGVIGPSTSPWASPIVLVEKKDGGIRFCVDYRKLNQVAKFDAYPMPRIEEMFELLALLLSFPPLILPRGTGRSRCRQPPERDCLCYPIRPL